MKAVLFKLKQGAKFHFGMYAPDVDTSLSRGDIIFHSDSLFSSLIVTYNNLYTDTNLFVRQFKDNNIQISSINYFLEINNKKIYFLPKPIHFNLTNVNEYKSFKKIQFISKYLYEIINHPGELLEDSVIILQQKFAVHKSELIDIEHYSVFLRLFDKELYQKVFVNKKTQGDDLYQLDVLEISDNLNLKVPISVGFYFLKMTSEDFDKEYNNKLKNIYEILKNEGIGAEKSTMGNIEDIEEVDWKLDIKTQHPSYKMTASLFFPQDSENDDVVYAQTILRGGRTLGSGEKSSEDGRKRLKVTRMVKEGSILNKNTIGSIQDISPDDWKNTPFLRNGKALLLDVNQNWFQNE